MLQQHEYLHVAQRCSHARAFSPKSLALAPLMPRHGGIGSICRCHSSHRACQPQQ
ncbi:uncharacterized protein TRIVIDRAFT_92940 [Trichoderma virens Gv29-8]|uniref:Uncharacterized protein n=1 Tax=Hypocrea virens (strain Gv29-8 / FGSC 10586) TaxID=413071 RepID=G9MYS0_HYPVG|nr:uncharacterized protein TRIVIDRAFT_92940 [Trichoderma virens Gv29-8]EHK20250.1 hypothetical protein TRIVIDRAFT_92940 [Trichoderma virens Gv29-8]